MRSSLFAFMVLAAVGTALPREAAAQSFFEKLFGLGAPSTPRISVAPPAQVIPPASYRSAPAVSRASRDDEGDEDAPKTYRTGKIRAVCVRLCDGYFFPLNDHASAQTLQHEAERCQSACGTEARLFYQDQEDPDPAAMLDLKGQRYDKLETAFLYRKRLIGGCGCKPAPWSFAERERHRGYAIAEALAQQAHAARLAEAGASVPLPSRKPDGVQLAAAEPFLEPPVDGEPRAEASQPDAARNDGATNTAGDAGVWTSAVATTSADPQAVPHDLADDAAAILAQRARPSRRVSLPSQGARTTPRLAEAARAKPVRANVSRSKPQRLASSQPSGFSFGKPKYVWPGDR